MDVVDKAARSRMMAGIRAKDTKPEVMVRRALHAQGLRFRLHRRDLPGTPDIVLPRHKVAIFVHGCFWHHHQGCQNAKLPTTRPEFWATKLQGNRDRDAARISELVALGWRVAIIWECATRRDMSATAGSVMDWIRNGTGLTLKIE